MGTTELGTILGLWAHPDDEVFASAGLMMRAVSNGQRVVVVTATKGDAGQTADEVQWPQEKLAEIREQELKRSLETIGVREHFWLDYADGKLAGVPTVEVVAALQKTLGDFCPDTIVTFEPQGITGHEDHQAVYLWAKEFAGSFSVEPRVLCAVECEEFYESHGRALHAEHNIYFNVSKPHVVSANDADVCVSLNEEEQAIKLGALTAHASQTAGMLASQQGREALSALCKCECFTIAG
jgi:LmbE family N-acetylglucosaminyl deacetylase